MRSCFGCEWYRLETRTIEDYEGTSTTYSHVCYRESGSPCVRTTGESTIAPPRCVDYFEEVE